MADLFRSLIHDYPALLWLLLGGVLVVLINRKFGSFVALHADNIGKLHEKEVESQKNLLASQEKLLEMQKTHYEAELNELRKKHDHDYAKIESERNSYRDQLHACRNELGAKLEAANLKIGELEQRPTVEALYAQEKDWHKTREEFYRTITDQQRQITVTMKGIMDTIARHDAELAERHEKLSAVQGTILDTLQRQTDALQALVSSVTRLPARKRRILPVSETP